MRPTGPTKGRTPKCRFPSSRSRTASSSSRLEAEQTTASGLVIPDTAKEKPQEGEVLAVGPGRIDDKGNRVPLDVKVGDRVIYSKYGGTEIKHGGQEYLILSARDVLAIVG
jgi:chaperonin GroES